MARACFRRFYKLRALNDRRKLVEAAARKSNLDARLQRALKRLLNRFEGAADRRTEIAHLAAFAAFISLFCRCCT
jgi:hypothetical protein